MNTINRSAIIVRTKKPFLDWLNFIDPNGPTVTLNQLNIDPTVYLVPEFDNEEEVMSWLSSGAYEDIFEAQFFGWNTDESVWPQGRTFKMFGEWFDFETHSILEDLSAEPLEHDEE